jgi:CheY-like chemotaxis protein
MLSLELEGSKYKSTIDMILNSSKVLLSLINDVLDFAKYESGKMTFESVKFNLKDELEEVLDTFELLINEKNLLFKCLNLDTLNYIVIGDPTKIKQIFFNLLNNALKFTNEGGITIHFDSEIISNELKLSVEITDTGIGMAKKSQKYLFEPFKQGHDLIHKEFGGTGLGLSITKEIIEHMKGKVAFESILMAGTTCYFSITLPISDEHGKNEETLIEPIIFNKVLYVEDNIVNQKLMQQYFKKYRVPFDIAFDGKEAVSKFSKGSYDLIFMDLQMPIMDGYEATELIRQMDESVYIIAMTAYTSNEVRDKCRLVGMNDYISKPVDFYYLAALFDIKDVNRMSLISSDELMTEHATLLSQMIDFDVEVCLELIMTFVNQLQESFVKIEGLRLKGDIESIGNIIHKMKGGSATVRLEKINHLFIKVETLISNNKYPEAFDVIDQIKEFAILK